MWCMTLPAKIEVYLRPWVTPWCWPLWVWEHRCSPLTLMRGAPEAAGVRWSVAVVEAVEAAGDPAWEQGEPSAPQPPSRLVYSTAELQHHCLNVLVLLNARMPLNTHLTVQHRRKVHWYRDVTRTGAVSGAASAAAASAGGAAPAGWRTASRWLRPRKGRSREPGRRGRQPAVYVAQTLHSFANVTHYNSPKRDTWLRGWVVLLHGLCAHTQPDREANNAKS